MDTATAPVTGVDPEDFPALLDAQRDDPPDPPLPRTPHPRLPLYPPRDLGGDGQTISLTISKAVLAALDALVRDGHGSRSDLIERCVEHFVGRAEARLA